MVENRCNYPRGKGFGGTTIINGLIYSRGNKLDYDKWESEGNPGWSYRSVLPYFIKSENTSIDDAEPGYHGKSGYVHIEYHRPVVKQVRAFFEANKLLGRKEIDYNGKSQLGVSRGQQYMINGSRETHARAFLKPAFQRRNLVMLRNSFVTKIDIHPITKQARGVYFNR